MSTGQKRKINVKTITQQVFSLEVPYDISISDLKREVLTVSQVPVDRQRLIYLGKALQDAQKLNEIITEDGQTIHLMAITQPAGAQNPQQSQPQNQPNAQQRSQISFTIPAGAQQNAVNPLQGYLGQVGQLFAQLSQEQMRAAGQNQRLQQAQQQAQQQATLHSHQQPQQQPQQHPQGPPQARPTGDFQEVHFLQSEPRGTRVQLPQHVIQSITKNIDSMLHPDAMFPGPPLPVMNSNRTNITTLAQFLHQTCFAIQRSLPIMQRTADILLRESYQDQAQERVHTERLCKMTASILADLQRLLDPIVIAILANLTLGNAPGQYHLQVPTRLIESQIRQPNQPHDQTHYPHQNNQPVQQPPTLTQQQAQQPQQQRQQGQGQQQQSNQVSQPTQIPQGQNSQPLQPEAEAAQQNAQGINMQIENSVEMTIGQDIQSISINVNGQNLEGAVAGLEGIDQILSGISSQLIQQPGFQGHIQFTHAQQPSNPIQQPPQQQNSGQQPAQNLQLHPQQGGIPLQAQNMMQGLLGGLVGGQGQNIFTMSIQDLMMQNYSNQMEEGEAEILAIFSDVKVGDIMGAQMTGNYSFLDGLQGSIKAKMHKQIEKCEGKIEFCEKIANSFISTFIPTSAHQHLVMEGFDPKLIGQEVLLKHMKQFIQIIDKDYTSSVERFSDAMVAQFYKMVGEVVYEIVEGLNNGLQDYQQIVSHNLNELVKKTMSAEMAMMFSGLLSGFIWPFVLKSYTQYKQQLEQQQSLQQSATLTEDQLLKQIEEASQACQRDLNIQFSAAYKKGDPKYNEFD